jgi:hypothetical protein
MYFSWFLTDISISIYFLKIDILSDRKYSLNTSVTKPLVSVSGVFSHISHIDCVVFDISCFAEDDPFFRFYLDLYRAYSKNPWSVDQYSFGFGILMRSLSRCLISLVTSSGGIILDFRIPSEDTEHHCLPVYLRQTLQDRLCLQENLFSCRLYIFQPAWTPFISSPSGIQVAIAFPN